MQRFFSVPISHTGNQKLCIPSCNLSAVTQTVLTAEDKIRVFAEQGCWSYVGRLGGKQDLSLGRGCESVGTAAHELGHALGFFHTMSRHDRDNYITLNAHNVKVSAMKTARIPTRSVFLQPDWLDQFTKQTPQTNENYGITYDYGSIMHYGGTRYSSVHPHSVCSLRSLFP